jgi:hypothetical protein
MHFSACGYPSGIIQSRLYSPELMVYTMTRWAPDVGILATELYLIHLVAGKNPTSPFTMKGVDSGAFPTLQGHIHKGFIQPCNKERVLRQNIVARKTTLHSAGHLLSNGPDALVKSHDLKGLACWAPARRKRAVHARIDTHCKGCHFQQPLQTTLW